LNQVGQCSQLWWDLTLINSLRLLRHLYRIPEKRHSYNLTRLRKMLDLDAFLDTPVRQLSLEQRMVVTWHRHCYITQNCCTSMSQRLD